MEVTMLNVPSKSERIRDVNDRFRTTFVGGVVTVTSGIAALCREVRAEVLRRVRTFSHFNEDNDPHHEHDFGAFNIGGQRYFFKIDYYNREMDGGSEDPADTSKTTRVLTIMLAEEY
jgi:hypothetical protein